MQQAANQSFNQQFVSAVKVLETFGGNFKAAIEERTSKLGKKYILTTISRGTESYGPIYSVKSSIDGTLWFNRKSLYEAMTAKEREERELDFLRSIKPVSVEANTEQSQVTPIAFIDNVKGLINNAIPASQIPGW